MSTEHIESTTPSHTIAINQDSETSSNVHPHEERAIEQARVQLPWGWRDALALLALLLLVVAMAWRYTPDFGAEVAGEWWDPLLNMWTLSWDTTILIHAPAHLWQAPLLYPNMLTLSYSENLLGEVIFYGPVFLLTHNPVLAYNVTFYLLLLLCGVTMYIAARSYTGKRLAAFVAALIYAFAPYRLGQIDHIHIIAGAWIPLAFLSLDRALQRGGWRHWSLFALCYLLQLLSSIYYGIFLSYALLAYTLIRYARPLLAQLRRQRKVYLTYLLRRAVQPLVVFAALVVLLATLMTPYLLSLRSGLGRSLVQTADFSAFVRDFGFSAPFNWLHGISAYNGVPLLLDSEHYLFLGWTTMALALLGVTLAVRHRHPAIRAYAWTALLVLLFAFGPALQFAAPGGAPLISHPAPSGAPPAQPYAPGTPMPWLLAYYALPGFKGLRVPARLVGVLLLMLALLAAYMVAWLQEISQRRAVQLTEEQSRKADAKQPSLWSTLALRCILVLIPCLLLLEAVPAYLPVTHVPIGNQVPAVYQWLATHGGQQPIAELPMANGDQGFTSQDEAWYDYYAIYHPHPIVNGWSGYRPPLTWQIAGLLLTFPSQESLRMLRFYHIQYVVVHFQRYRPDTASTLRARLAASPDLQRIAAFGSDIVWQVIVPRGLATRGLSLASTAILHTGEGVQLWLQRPRYPGRPRTILGHMTTAPF